MHHFITFIRVFSLNIVFFGLLISWVKVEAKSIEFMSYNVENLFDAIDDPNTSDEEFTPGGQLRWTAAKARWKVQKVAEVIKEISDQGIRCPDILMLVEVENPAMVKQLRDQGLSECGYKVTIAEAKSNDPRGIRVALLSRLPLLSRPTTIVPYAGSRSTIEAHFSLAGRPLVIFANHWKSRRVMGKSTDNGEDKRRAAAKAVFQRIQQLREQNPDLEFLVAGDLNDEPENKSIAQDMQVAYQPLEDLTNGFHFWNPSIELKRFLELPQFIDLDATEQEAIFRKLRGTYYFAKERVFNQLDHILLSSSLFDDEGIHYRRNSFEVVRRKNFVTRGGAPLSFNAALTPPVFGDTTLPGDEGEEVILEIETGSVDPVENPIIQGASDHFPIRVRLDYDDSLSSNALTLSSNALK